MMLEIARPDSMLPQQTDIAARIVARYANACGFDEKPKPGCIWAIDLAQPRPPELVTGVALPTARFFGAGAAMVKIQEVIRRLAADLHAKEQRFGTIFPRGMPRTKAAGRKSRQIRGGDRGCTGVCGSLPPDTARAVPRLGEAHTWIGRETHGAAGHRRRRGHDRRDG